MKIYTKEPVIPLGGVTEWSDSEPGVTFRFGIVGATISNGAGVVTLPWAGIAVEHDLDDHGNPILPDWLGLEPEKRKK
jgi:hypothetical protein